MSTEVIDRLRMQGDRAAAWACVLAGVVTLFLGWLGVSGTAFAAKQMPFIAGYGLAGFVLLGTGAVLWLSADLRDEWRQLDLIEEALAEHRPIARDAAFPAARPIAAPVALEKPQPSAGRSIQLSSRPRRGAGVGSEN